MNTYLIDGEVRANFRDLPIEAENEAIAKEIVVEELSFIDVVDYILDAEINIGYVSQEEE